MRVGSWKPTEETFDLRPSATQSPRVPADVKSQQSRKSYHSQKGTSKRPRTEASSEHPRDQSIAHPSNEMQLAMLRSNPNPETTPQVQSSPVQVSPIPSKPGYLIYTWSAISQWWLDRCPRSSARASLLRENMTSRSRIAIIPYGRGGHFHREKHDVVVLYLSELEETGDNTQSEEL